MSIPDYQTLMRPLLDLSAEVGSSTRAALRDELSKRMGLSEEDLAKETATGHSLWGSRFHWARTYLVKAGALAAPARGVLEPTDRGRALLAEHPDRIDNKVLDGFEEFVEWRKRSAKRPAATTMARATVRLVNDLDLCRTGRL